MRHFKRLPLSSMTFGFLAALFVTLASFSQSFAAEPSATIDLADGKTLQGAIDLPAFVIKTDYGFLTVPAGDVIAAWPGFEGSKSTLDRVDVLVQRLNSATASAAATELRRIGRVAVPALQKAAAGPDKAITQQAEAILKELWPSGAKVYTKGEAVLAARAFVIRGQMTFRSLHVVTDKGPVVVAQDQMRLIRFTQGDAPDVPDWPSYPEAASARPSLEIQLPDGSRLRGQLDRAAITVTTPYGVLNVPLKSLVSIKPGAAADQDEVTTRQFLVRGSIDPGTFNLTTKMGPLALARGKFDMITVVGVEEVAATPPAPAQPETKPAEDKGWQNLFNGKDLKGWRKWGPGTADIVEKSIVLDGECGLSYDSMAPMSDLIISAEVKLIKPGVTKLALRETSKGLYQVEFTGNNGSISRWDNEAQKNIVLKGFNFTPTADQIYRLQFGALGNVLMAYVNDEKVAEVTLPDDQVLGPGSVNVAIWRATAAFRAIQMKQLK